MRSRQTFARLQSWPLRQLSRPDHQDSSPPSRLACSSRTAPHPFLSTVAAPQSLPSKTLHTVERHKKSQDQSPISHIGEITHLVSPPSTTSLIFEVPLLKLIRSMHALQFKGSPTTPKHACPSQASTFGLQAISRLWRGANESYPSSRLWFQTPVTICFLQRRCKGFQRHAFCRCKAEKEVALRTRISRSLFTTPHARLCCWGTYLRHKVICSSLTTNLMRSCFFFSLCKWSPAWRVGITCEGIH